MTAEKPSLNQITNLHQHMSKDEALTKHFIINDLLDTEMTLKQYKYVQSLWLNNKRRELNELFRGLGIRETDEAKRERFRNETEAQEVPYFSSKYEEQRELEKVEVWKREEKFTK